ncbi:unnamed protein product, partial [Ectocarpus sp. 8 AP-2014]
SLLEAGADGSAGWRGCLDRTLLDAAALGGSEPVVSALLRAGAQTDVNTISISSKRSALYTATVCDHEHAARRLDRIVSTLLLRGAYTDAQDNSGATPLIYACRSGHLSVVNTLLAAGAEVDTIRDVDSYSALDKAVCNGHVDVIGALLRHGADVNACDHAGFTPLHLAAQKDQAGAIDALMQAGPTSSPARAVRWRPPCSPPRTRAISKPCTLSCGMVHP